MTEPHHLPSNLLVRPTETDRPPGRINRVTPGRARWELLNFEVLRLGQGDTIRRSTGDGETVVVALGGAGSVSWNAGAPEPFGRRPDVFSGMPHAAYFSRSTEWRVDAREGGIEIALCAAPSDQDHPARLIRPEEIGIELRGGGHASRQINSIVPPGFDCHRLVCVEVYTPAGNWSSYPPHKHDTHRTAADGTLAEADLEEIYFYKIRDPRGFAIQRVYNDDRSLDATLAPGNNDIVLVPEGYHPVSAPVGYDCYYLNFLAGSAQSLAATDDPDHSWIKGELGGLDPRVPMVDLSMEAPR